MASRNPTTRRSKIPTASQPAGAMPSVKVDTVAAAAPPKGGRKVKKTVKSEAGKAENGNAEGGKSSAPAGQAKKEAGAEGRRSTAGRHLSVVDTNRGGSRGSAGDLEDSVFAEAKSRLGSLANSLSKHRRSLSRGKSPGTAPAPFLPKRDGQQAEHPAPCSAIVVSGPPPATAPFLPALPALPAGVIDIDIEEDGVNEYGEDMFAYMKEKEAGVVVAEDYLEQSSITADQRAVLVDWLLQVQHYLKLTQESLYLGISLLDRVLDRRDVEHDKLQLVGITALYVASKMEEYYPADLKKLVHLTENSYTIKEVYNMELVLLGVVHFEIYVPTPSDFLPRLGRAALRPHGQFLQTCHYLVDSHLPYPSHPTIAPSLLASGAVLAAAALYHAQANPSHAAEVAELWSATLAHYSGYSLAQVQPCAAALLAALHQAKHAGSRTKYCSRSQHSRLAEASHLARAVVSAARTVCTS